VPTRLSIVKRSSIVKIVFILLLSPLLNLAVILPATAFSSICRDGSQIPYTFIDSAWWANIGLGRGVAKECFSSLTIHLRFLSDSSIDTDNKEQSSIPRPLSAVNSHRTSFLVGWICPSPLGCCLSIKTVIKQFLGSNISGLATSGLDGSNLANNRDSARFCRNAKITKNAVPATKSTVPTPIMTVQNNICDSNSNTEIFPLYAAYKIGFYIEAFLVLLQTTLFWLYYFVCKVNNSQK